MAASSMTSTSIAASQVMSASPPAVVDAAWQVIRLLRSAHLRPALGARLCPHRPPELEEQERTEGRDGEAQRGVAPLVTTAPDLRQPPAGQVARVPPPGARQVDPVTGEDAAHDAFPRPVSGHQAHRWSCG